MGAGSGVPPSFFAGAIDPDDYARRFAHDGTRTGGRAARVLLLMSGLVAALAAGAFGMHWIDSQGGVQAALATWTSRGTPAAVGSAEAGAPAAAPDTAELPYEGEAPPARTAATQADGDTVREAAAGSRQAPDKRITATAPKRTSAARDAAAGGPAGTERVPAASSGKSGGGAASSGGAAGDDDADASRTEKASGQENRREDGRGGGEAQRGDEDGNARDTPARTVPSREIASRESSKSTATREGAGKTPAGARTAAAKSSSARDRQDGGTKTARTSTASSQASGAAQRVSRGREISRIQAQADEELKKKTRRGTGTVAAARATRPPALSFTRQALARCEKADNLFRREQCKWRICEDKWGRDGCPSFERARVVFD